MTLATADLVWYYTGTASGVSDNTASIGGTLNANTIESALANNVFDDVTGAEAASGESHYRAIVLKDTNATDNYIDYKAWTEGYTRAASGADTILFSLEKPQGTSFGTGTIATASDEYTVPDTTNFMQGWVVEGAPSSTITASDTLIAASGSQDWVGIWLWRTIPAGASAYSNRDCTIKFQGETTGSPRMIVQKTWSIHWNKEGQISVHEV